MDYTQLITSEHNQQPDFVQNVALTVNAIGQVTALIDSLPALFDIGAAVAPQLDVDGQWVGLTRTVTGVLLVNFFGFADDSSALSFQELGQPATGGRFIELGELATSNAVLGDPEYRTLLEAKIIANAYDGNIMDYDSAVADVIGVPVITIDPGVYVVMIVVTQPIDPEISQLLTGYDILPRPGGVRYQFAFPLSPLTWTTAGTATGSGSTVAKPSGAAAWDSAAWIASPFNHLYMSWTAASATLEFIGGLAANPSGSPNYPSVNFGILVLNGTIYIYESGTQIGTFGSCSAGDSFAVYYDGKQAVYLHNNQVLRVKAAAPGSLSPMFSLFSVGAQANNIFVATG